jgi:hypothetical protein
MCKGLKLDLYSIKLGHELCTKSLEKEREKRDKSSRIVEEVVYKAVAEQEQARRALPETFPSETGRSPGFVEYMHTYVLHKVDEVSERRFSFLGEACELLSRMMGVSAVRPCAVYAWIPECLELLTPRISDVRQQPDSVVCY